MLSQHRFLPLASQLPKRHGRCLIVARPSIDLCPHRGLPPFHRPVATGSAPSARAAAHLSQQGPCFMPRLPKPALERSPRSHLTTTDSLGGHRRPGEPVRAVELHRCSPTRRLPGDHGRTMRFRKSVGHPLPHSLLFPLPSPWRLLGSSRPSLLLLFPFLAREEAAGLLVIWFRLFLLSTYIFFFSSPTASSEQATLDR